MFKRKFAAIAAAATLSVALAPAASAQLIDETSSELPFASVLSSEEPWASLGQDIFQVVGSAIWTPVILSTMASSIFAPQCNLFDTRGC